MFQTICLTITDCRKSRTQPPDETGWMMMGSTSPLELQQSHQHRFVKTKPSDPDVAYHIEKHNSLRSMETQEIFHQHCTSLEDIPDTGYLLPQYTEDMTAKDNARVQRTPSGLSPPQKRHSLSPQSHFIASHGYVPPNNAGSLRRSNTQNIEMSRHSLILNNQCSPTNVHRSSSSADTTTTTTMGYEGQPFYDRSSYVTNEQNANENGVAASPTGARRHPSQSSTHSSGSSTVSKVVTLSRSYSKSSKISMKAPLQVPNLMLDDDDDDSWKVCSVCGDKATGYHFNALTCEGCKGFFRRTMKNGKDFTCPYTGNCTITKSNRRQCQACRLQKCLRIGMKKECIMSRMEIQMKRNLMLNNRIKRSIVEWKPLEYTEERRQLVELIHNSHCQTNNPPDIQQEDSIITVEKNPCVSPTSSMHSGFSDLINQMTQDIVATAPVQNTACKAHVRHFSAIMEFSIKEIIKFCKKIHTFVSLSLKDQITLLKSGCTEVLFIKANYTFDREQNALVCGPGKYYTRESFIAGGMSEEYTDCYLQFHHDLSHMMLDDMELACMCAATLFAADRDELENKAAVEAQQEEIAVALQAYTENTYHCRLRFPKIMAYLTRLRTLNWHISKTLLSLQNSNADDVTPLVLEVVPTV